jgi:hypothetical protein
MVRWVIATRIGGLKNRIRCAISCSCMGLILTAGSAILRAQDPVQPDTAPMGVPKPALPLQTPPQPEDSQQPGAGAQVRTGSQFAQTGDMSFAARLARLLADHQFLELESLLNSPDPDAAKPNAPDRLSPQQKQLFRGVLANRDNKPQQSIQLLEPLLDSAVAAGDVQTETMLRKTLAEDYLRVGDWSKAAGAYQTLDTKLGASLSADQKAEIELPLKLLPLVVENPPMTVEYGDAFSLPYDRDALGLTDVPVFVDAQSHDWMLDPTAPFNLICRSSARQIGLKLSLASATVTTITGRPIQVHATIIPRLTVGTVTFRNMTAFVFDDADYYFPRTKYQVRGVLGYPAVSALGSLTVTANSSIEVQPGQKGERLTKGARFFLDGDRIIAALGRPGDERMFVIDAGGQETYLTSRFYAEHISDFTELKMQLLPPPGTGDKTPVPTYVAETVPVLVGNTRVSFQYVPVLTQPIGDSAVDDTYGTLGMDALDELKSYTFDYRTMRFAVRNQ